MNYVVGIVLWGNSTNQAKNYIFEEAYTYFMQTYAKVVMR